MRCPKNPVMTPIMLTSNYPLLLCAPQNYDILMAGLWPRFLFLTQRGLAGDSHLINVYWTCKVLSKQESEWIIFTTKNSISHDTKVTHTRRHPLPAHLSPFSITKCITITCDNCVLHLNVNYLFSLSEFYQMKLSCNAHIRGHVTNTILRKAHEKKELGMNRSNYGLNYELGEICIFFAH